MSGLEIYLAIITTVLVATQVIRSVQNTISLRRNKKVFMKQLGHLDEVTREDMEMQRNAYRCVVELCDWVKKGLRLG